SLCTVIGSDSSPPLRTRYFLPGFTSRNRTPPCSSAFWVATVVLPLTSETGAFGARPVTSTCSTLSCTSNADALAATARLARTARTAAIATFRARPPARLSPPTRPSTPARLTRSTCPPISARTRSLESLARFRPPSTGTMLERAPIYPRPPGSNQKRPASWRQVCRLIAALPGYTPALDGGDGSRSRRGQGSADPTR